MSILQLSSVQQFPDSSFQIDQFPSNRNYKQSGEILP